MIKRSVTGIEKLTKFHGLWRILFLIKRLLWISPDTMHSFKSTATFAITSSVFWIILSWNPLHNASWLSTATLCKMQFLPIKETASFSLQEDTKLISFETELSTFKNFPDYFDHHHISSSKDFVPIENYCIFCTWLNWNQRYDMNNEHWHCKNIRFPRIVVDFIFVTILAFSATSISANLWYWTKSDICFKAMFFVPMMY